MLPELRDAASSRRGCRVRRFRVVVAQLATVRQRRCWTRAKITRHLQLRRRSQQHRHRRATAPLDHRGQHPRCAHRRHRRHRDAADPRRRPPRRGGRPIRRAREVHRLGARTAARPRRLRTCSVWPGSGGSPGPPRGGPWPSACRWRSVPASRRPARRRRELGEFAGSPAPALQELVATSDFLSLHVPLTAAHPPPRQRRSAAADEATRDPGQHRPRAGRRRDGAGAGLRPE